MLKQSITYTNFDEEEVTEIHYFNLSKDELMTLEVSHDGMSLGKHLQSIVEKKDNRALIEEFKKIILLTFGEKSEDGKYFIKTDEVRQKFSHSAAFQELYVMMISDAKFLVDFIVGVMPKDMQSDIRQQIQDEIDTKPKISTSELAAAAAAKESEPTG